MAPSNITKTTASHLPLAANTVPAAS